MTPNDVTSWCCFLLNILATSVTTFLLKSTAAATPAHCLILLLCSILLLLLLYIQLMLLLQNVDAAADISHCCSANQIAVPLFLSSKLFLSFLLHPKDIATWWNKILKLPVLLALVIYSRTASKIVFLEEKNSSSFCFFSSDIWWKEYGANSLSWLFATLSGSSKIYSCTLPAVWI